MRPLRQNASQCINLPDQSPRTPDSRQGIGCPPEIHVNPPSMRGQSWQTHHLSVSYRWSSGNDGNHSAACFERNLSAKTRACQHSVHSPASAVRWMFPNTRVGARESLNRMLGTCHPDHRLSLMAIDAVRCSCDADVTLSSPAVPLPVRNANVIGKVPPGSSQKTSGLDSMPDWSVLRIQDRSESCHFWSGTTVTLVSTACSQTPSLLTSTDKS